MPVLARDDSGEHRPVHAGDGTDEELAASHQGAGVAGTDKRGCRTFLDEVESPDHRGIFFPHDGPQGLVFHRDHLGGMHDGEPTMIFQTGCGN